MSRDLERLADLIRDESGIDIRGARLSSLSTAIAKVAPGMSPGRVLRATGDGERGASLKARLVEAITVHETFFMRQRRDFDAIDWQRLLASAREAGSEHVRIWVAACATGEEAYTVALLAAQAFGSTTPPVSVLASDISSAALLRAERGRYGTRSARNLDADARARYFTADGRHLVVGPHLRKLVEFRRHNLLDPAPQGRQFELILCRNVLIYFDGPTVDEVVRRLEDALAPGGMLVLGAADRLCRPASPRRHEAVRPRPHPAPERRAPSRSWRSAPRLVQPAPEPVETDLVTGAMTAVDRGRPQDALALTASVLDADPLRADAHFVRGLALLQQDRAREAADALRRALYIAPGCAQAAFTLGRAYDELGDDVGARRAYAQALRTLEPGQDDVAAACHARLARG